MTKQQFPLLAQFCGAYFHQNWDLEAPDALAVIRNYIKDKSIFQVQQTINEIERLLLLSRYIDTEQLTKIIEYDLQCYYNPTAYGISLRDWLIWVQISLKQGTSKAIALSA